MVANFKKVTKVLTEFILSQLNDLKTSLNIQMNDNITFETFSKNLKGFESRIIKNPKTDLITSIIYKVPIESSGSLSGFSEITKTFYRDNLQRVVKISLSGHSLPNPLKFNKFKKNKIIIYNDNSSEISIKYE